MKFNNANRIIGLLFVSCSWIIIEILVVIIGSIILLSGCEKPVEKVFHVEPGLQSQILPKNACFNDIIIPTQLWKAWPDTMPVFDHLNYSAIDWITNDWQGPTTVDGHEAILDSFIIRSVAIDNDVVNWIYCTQPINSYYLKLWQEDDLLLFDTNAPTVSGEWKLEDPGLQNPYYQLMFKYAGQDFFTRIGEVRQVPGYEDQIFIHTADTVLFMQYQRGDTL